MPRFGQDYFRTLIYVERARKERESTKVEIVEESSRHAVVRFDCGPGDVIHCRLSKRNRHDNSALGIVREFIAGEI